MKWLVERYKDLTYRGSYMPYERRVLLRLAVFRAQFTFSVPMAFAVVRIAEGWPVWVVLMLTGPDAVLAALVSADFIEHWWKRLPPPLGLGYTYDPYVMAIGEWEGYMGPVDPRDTLSIQRWNDMKCGPPPGGNAQPLLPWWGNPSSGSFCKESS